MRDFSKLRIAVALAPETSFSGHDYVIGQASLKSLVDLGAQVETVPWFDWANEAKRRTIVARLRDFSPHFATSFPNAGYGVLMQEGSPGEDDADNLFADILRVPLVLNWDHIIPQGPNYFLGARLYEGPPRRGALRALQRKFQNPFFRHYSPDSGHIAVLEKMDLIKAGEALHYSPGARDHFVAAGQTLPESARRGRVGFSGNIYASRGSKLPILQHPTFREIDDYLLRAKRSDWQRSGWDLLLEAVADLPGDTRVELGLDPDYPLFWLVALDLLGDRVLTAFRLAVLEAIRQPVDFFGNFADPDSLHALQELEHVRYCGNADFFRELPHVYRSREIWVDATNAPFISGCGAKAIDCFAAGSMMLVDYRKDLLEKVGPLAERFMYRSPDELRQKIAYFLDHSDERLQIVQEMQAIIRDRLTYRHHYERMCADMQAELEAGCT